MRLPCWLGNDIAVAYGNPAIPADDTQLPFSEVWPKANDGLSWQGVFDGHPSAARDEASLSALYTTYVLQGIACKPWGVINALEPVAEGAFAGRIAAAAGGIYIVDLEPAEPASAGGFNYYQANIASVGAPAAYADAFRAAGGFDLWIAPDARPGRIESCHPQQWADHPAVKFWLPQVYWTTFQQPWEYAVDTALSVLAQYQIPHSRISVICPGDAEPADFIGACVELKRLGCPPPSIYQRGILRADLAAAIEVTPSPWAAEFPQTRSAWEPVPAPPAPPPPPAPEPAGVRLARELRAIADQVEGLR